MKLLNSNEPHSFCGSIINRTEQEERAEMESKLRSEIADLTKRNIMIQHKDNQYRVILCFPCCSLRQFIR